MAATPGPHDRLAPPARPRAAGAFRFVSRLLSALLSVAPLAAFGELPPEIGYVFPAGGRAGETRDVVLGGYDWTADIEILPHDPGVALVVTGAPTRVLIPEPPHLFGYKARANDRPCPREFPARLSLPADLPPGLHRFQVANANGASPPGLFHLSRYESVVEDPDRECPQLLPALPLVIDGRIGRTAQIDRYRFTLNESGPVSIELFARRLLSPLHALVKVTDSHGGVVLDVADTPGRDLSVSFPGKEGETYTLSIHDIDYAGDRSSVYRIELATGPLDMPMPLSDIPEIIAPEGTTDISLPAPPGAVRAAFAGENRSRSVVTDLPAGSWRVSAKSTSASHPLDLDLSILAPDGRELLFADDGAGSVDPVATVTVATAAAHRIVVGGRAIGATELGPAAWRLVIEPDSESFEPGPALAAQLAVPLGGAAKLTIPIVRAGGFAGAVGIGFRGLPAGVTATEGSIKAGTAEGTVELACGTDTGTAARLATLVLSGTTSDGRPFTHEKPIAVAVTMKPRVRIVPDGLDDVRKVHRGTTFRGPLTIYRLEGFEGDVRLHPTAKQQRHRQGMDGEEIVVPAGATHCDYPVFVPEWMETTRTSRFIVNAAVDVTDPRGAKRTLLERQELRLGMLPEGAIMKLAGPAEIRLKHGATAAIALGLERAAEFRTPAFAGPVRVELVREGLPRAWREGNLVTSEPVVIENDGAEEAHATLTVSVADDPRIAGEGTITIRATALEEGRWPVVSEATVVGIVE
jgi:hypothetical protein